MNRFTRREFLHGLAAGTALSALPPLARAFAPWPQAGISPFQRVNVLFHGLSVIEFASDEVRVYLPAVDTLRAYLAGSWMQEGTLARGEKYRLSGVMTGPRPALQDIDPQGNAVFNDRKLDTSLAYCTLVFPFPDFVTPLRPLRRKRNTSFFTGFPQPIEDPKSLPQLLAFTYVHPDPTTPLEFRPAGWTPIVESGVVNLHVWDAPVKPPTPQASRQALQQVAKMIGAPSLRLDFLYDSVQSPPPEKDPVVDNLSCFEELTLIERTSEQQGCGKHSPFHPKDDSGLNSLAIMLY